jgi:hypothetical protein
MVALIEHRHEALGIASFSILFYSVIAFMSYHYYQKFVMIEKLNHGGVSSSVYYRNNLGKYDETKKLFFSILMISSLLDIPEYINCLVQDGPTDCQTDTPDFLIFWFCHLLALDGYACCIIIPCVLWSDMINKKDGKLFNSKFDDDIIKIFFKCILCLYFMNTFFMIVCAIIYFSMTPSEYASQIYYAICAFAEAILITLISLGCLFSGVNLLSYVKSAKLPEIIENKFIITLNVILFVMVLSFLGRAVLIMRFSAFMPEEFRNGVPYSAYTVVSRWLPDIFCMYCLILIMRFSGQEIIDKNSNIITFSSKKSNNNYYQYTMIRRLYDCFRCQYVAIYCCFCCINVDEYKDSSSRNRSHFISVATDEGPQTTRKEVPQEYYSILTDPLLEYTRESQDNPLFFLEDPVGETTRNSHHGRGSLTRGPVPHHDSNSFSSVKSGGNKETYHHNNHSHTHTPHHNHHHNHHSSPPRQHLLPDDQFHYDDNADQPSDLGFNTKNTSFSHSQKHYSHRKTSASMNQNDFLFLSGAGLEEEGYTPRESEGTDV